MKHFADLKSDYVAAFDVAEGARARLWLAQFESHQAYAPTNSAELIAQAREAKQIAETNTSHAHAAMREAYPNNWRDLFRGQPHDFTVEVDWQRGFVL